jgi:adenosylcobinamide-GDP ribazoletransferase
MSYGMFCAIPQPFHLWDETCVNLILPCFPLVGVLIGALWWGTAKILVLSGLHIVLASAVLALLPFFATGFLHLDGYMDTSDAVLSRRPMEDKLRIVKDPHTGAFSVIMLAVLFTLQFASVFVVIEKGKNPALLIIIPIISRCCSALSILCLKPMAQSAYANMFRQNTGMSHKVFIVFVAISSAALSCFFMGIPGLIVGVSAITGFTVAIVYAYKDLKGVSGDLAGFALVIGELCALAAMAII